MGVRLLVTDRHLRSGERFSVGWNELHTSLLFHSCSLCSSLLSKDSDCSSSFINPLIMIYDEIQLQPLRVECGVESALLGSRSDPV
jgi:hypothetical protein